jgi:hypothetical protein
MVVLNDYEQLRQRMPWQFKVTILVIVDAINLLTIDQQQLAPARIWREKGWG